MSWVQSRVDLLRQIAVVFCVMHFIEKGFVKKKMERTLWLWRKAWTGSALLADTTAADDVQQQVKDIQRIVCVLNRESKNNFEKKNENERAISASTYLYERERNEQWWDLRFLSWSSNVSWHLNECSIKISTISFRNCWFSFKNFLGSSVGLDSEFFSNDGTSIQRSFVTVYYRGSYTVVTVIFSRIVYVVLKISN